MKTFSLYISEKDRAKKILRMYDTRNRVKVKVIRNLQPKENCKNQ